MIQNYGSHSMQARRWRVTPSLGLALVIAAGTAWSANDLDTLNPRGTTNRDGSNTFNTEWLGHNDLQGRTTYQTTVHTQGDRVIAYAGHFAGKMLNPMTGVVEENGTSIVDVTDPRHPKYLKHLIADKGGSRMAKLCDGNALPGKLYPGKTFLLRENGAVSHEVWDVTSPANPTLVSTPVSGVDVTHRNWWDCNSGIAYIVAGATNPSDAGFDGWNANSSPNQHLKIYDLRDPAHPKYIMDFGYPGQNPGSTFVMPGTETTTRTVPPGVHGPIVVSALNGKAINRLYMPYGVGSDGIIQIDDLTKVLPPPYGTGLYADVRRPSDAELLQGQIGVVYMPGAEGGHTSAEQHPWPISTVTVDDFSGRPNFCSRGTRFGVHSPAENFQDPTYARLLTSAWFDAGIRVTDIRDPYHPREVAHFIAPVNKFTQPSSAVINGVTYTALDVSCDNTDVDNRGLRYCGDRVGGGLDIVRLTGEAEEIARGNNDRDDRGD
jgi:hypothetical protein